MKIPLVQYQCNKCGTLTDVMDCDERLPDGWTFGESSHSHYCPQCSKKLREEQL